MSYLLLVLLHAPVDHTSKNLQVHPCKTTRIYASVFISLVNPFSDLFLDLYSCFVRHLDLDLNSKLQCIFISRNVCI